MVREGLARALERSEPAAPPKLRGGRPARAAAQRGSGRPGARPRAGHGAVSQAHGGWPARQGPPHNRSARVCTHKLRRLTSCIGSAQEVLIRRARGTPLIARESCAVGQPPAYSEPRFPAGALRPGGNASSHAHERRNRARHRPRALHDSAAGPRGRNVHGRPAANDPGADARHSTFTAWKRTLKQWQLCRRGTCNDPPCPGQRHVVRGSFPHPYAYRVKLTKRHDN